jgi:hypothetical protein
MNPVHQYYLKNIQKDPLHLPEPDLVLIPGFFGKEKLNFGLSFV